MKDAAESYDILYSLAENFNPKTYLEIGTREGASVACVLAKEQGIVKFVKDCLVDGRCFINDDIVKRVSELYTPRETLVYLFDRWEYVGSEGGHERLKHLLRDGFHLPNWQFRITDGDSKETLPKFLEEQTGIFDLVLVDGDHTPQGASADLENLVGRFRVLVMHDLFHPQHSYLEQVFLKYVRSHDYPYFIAGRRPPMMGTGVCFNL